jgi:4-hydroxy-tetrahydrodipicolinate reductase
MGRALIEMAAGQSATVVATKDIGDSLTEGFSEAHVAIDFSHHSATAPLAKACANKGIPLVIGTTGHSDEAQQHILTCCDFIPIVWAGNYSIGVTLLNHLTELAAKVLGDAYQPEIMEIHHRHKKDAPSGTALDLAKAVRNAEDFRSATFKEGRSGETGPRPTKEIGLHALRGGEVIGDHTVFFLGEDDRIELTHRAANRTIFASGAYRAAHWATRQAPGLYSMRDVLGLQPSNSIEQ